MREETSSSQRCDRIRSRHRKVSIKHFTLAQSSSSSTRAFGEARCGRKRGKLTMPVSALRCWDWKKTASSCLHAGQVLFDRGSYNRKKNTLSVTAVHVGMKVWHVV